VLPLTGLVGDLGLSTQEEAALVAYLKTLTDTEVVHAPRPYRANY
jgi:cytochrome c peroxidase